MKTFYEIKEFYKDKNLKDGTYSIDFIGDGVGVKPVSFSTGYQVSFDTHDGLNKPMYDAFAKTLQSRFKDAYLGVWNGNTEISFHIDEIDLAIEIGNIFSQKAIWDWKNGTEIYLKENKE